MAMSTANGQNNRLHLSFGVTDNPSNSNAETPAAHYHTGTWNLLFDFPLHVLERF
jgi:hypothetical protein